MFVFQIKKAISVTLQLFASLGSFVRYCPTSPKRTPGIRGLPGDSWLLLGCSAPSPTKILLQAQGFILKPEAKMCMEVTIRRLTFIFEREMLVGLMSAYAKNFGCLVIT